MAKVTSADSEENSAPEKATTGSHAAGSILTTLRNRVLNWHYPPGYHLGEVALCAEFSTSRVPVREALRALIEQGLVQKVPNQGCFVIQPDVDETHELYDMRLALELFVVESLSHHARLTPEWVQQQRDFWSPWLHVKADEQVDRTMLVDADSQFHLGLAEGLGNHAIVGALRSINERLRFVRLSAITNPHRIQATAGEHLALLDAIEKGQVEAARRSLRQNINHSRNKAEIAISRALMAAHGRRKQLIRDEENQFPAA
ncbi:MAG: GntR family transcriptional regulator [Synoicihabitans sp.]